MISPYNEPLFRAAIDYIENNPSEWDQREWEIHKDMPEKVKKDIIFYGSGISIRAEKGCGTTRCLAGTVVAIHYEHFDKSLYDILGINGGGDIERTAQNLLGLTYGEADEIFMLGTCHAACCIGDCGTSHHATLDDLKNKITEITGIDFKQNGEA